MRYVPINLVEEGMIVAKTIFNEQGAILLNSNSTLTRRIISRLELLGYKGLLIEDEISKDLDYKENFVTQEVKSSIAKRLNKTLLSGIRNQNHLDEEIDGLKSMIAGIIDGMFSEKELNLNLLELKMFDNYTYFHSVNVAIISLAIGYHLKLNKDDMMVVGIASLLHDIGKIYVDKEILNKPGKLTPQEFETMKAHSRKGYELLNRSDSLATRAAVSVLSHHEHYDGSGYPNGLNGEKIILFGRIICIADVYDALTSDRPYRDACTVLESIEYIMAHSGTQFDPTLVKLFTSKVYPYPVGSSVKLTNGEVGLVMQNSTEFCLRPQIKITDGDKEKIVDLMIDKRYRSVLIFGLHDNSSANDSPLYAESI